MTPNAVALPALGVAPVADPIADAGLPPLERRGTRRDRSADSSVASPARRRGRAISLRTEMGGALAVLVVLAAAVIGGVIGSNSVQQSRDRIGTSVATDSARIANRIAVEMAGRVRELSLVSSLDLFRELAATVPVPLPNGVVLPTNGPKTGPAHVVSVLDQLRRSEPSYQWLGMTDVPGRVLAATDPASVGRDVSTRGVAHLDARGAAPMLGAEPADGARDEFARRLIDLLVPIRAADNGVVGVVLAQLDWSWIEQIGRDTLTADDQGQTHRTLWLVGARDAVLVGPAAAVGKPMVLNTVARAKAGYGGWEVARWPDGEDYLTGAAPVGSDTPGTSAWTVVVAQSVDDAFAPAYDLRRLILLVGAGLALVCAGAGWLVAGWITAPLQRIAVAAERLRQGDDVELPQLRGALEIESLSASLRALVATLTRKQLALTEMEGMALHDPLTGLLNRSGMRVQLRLAVAQARAEGAGLLVFMSDLDGFKAVNDSLGHAAGDTLLQQVATRLTHAVRTGDTVARLGGDEFVLALKAPMGVRDEGAKSIARRALASISAPYELRGQSVRIGCSLGGACWPDHADVDGESARNDELGLDGVLERADAALYVVKRTGKGRILMHGET